MARTDRSIENERVRVKRLMRLAVANAVLFRHAQGWLSDGQAKTLSDNLDNIIDAIWNDCTPWITIRDRVKR